MSELKTKNNKENINGLIMQFEPETWEKICTCLEQVANLPLVMRIIIFGSRAKGNYKSDSDIDIAVFFDTDESYMLEHYHEIVKICNIPDIDMQVQAFPYDSLNDLCGIIDEIVRYGIVYYDV